MKWEQDLVRDIRFHSNKDDHDGNQEKIITRDTPHHTPHDEFTPCNHQYLAEHFLKIKDSCKSIVEIGVHRNGDKSSTWTFLNNKNDDTSYVGIDLDDKSFLNNPSKKIFTIRGNSSDIDRNIEIMKSFGIEQIDFLFIDGWHSVNQVLRDWEYTKILSPNGIVGFHDTAEHPGPFLFVRSLNTEKWNVEVNCCPDDWGIGFAQLK